MSGELITGAGGSRNRWMSSEVFGVRGLVSALILKSGKQMPLILGSFGVRFVGIVESFIVFKWRQLNGNVIARGLL